MEATSAQSHLTVSYREDLDIFFVRWTIVPLYQHANAGYQNALEIAAQKAARFWLVDLRGRDPETGQDESWMKNNFFEALHTRQPVRNFIAYLISPAHLHVLQERLGPLNNINPSNDLPIRYFTAENEAVNWLMSRQRLIF